MSEAKHDTKTMSRASDAFRAALEVVGTVDPAVAAAIASELADQRSSLKLIASENYASPAVLLAMGNWFGDKYAEGTIGRRMYAGCRNVDAVEKLAAERAQALFGAEHAYVQPHSGIDANLVAFWAVLAQRVEAPGVAAASVANVDELDDAGWRALRRALGDQRMIGMSLDAGGHLTHGFRRNISGKMFDQRSYGTDPVTGLVDYARVRRLAQEFRPLIVVAGYSAYPRLVNFAIMREIADEVGATLMVDMAHFAGSRCRSRPDRGLRPRPARSGCHLDHAQVAPRPPRWPGAVPTRAGRACRPRLSHGARRTARQHDGSQGSRPFRGGTA